MRQRLGVQTASTLAPGGPDETQSVAAEEACERSGGHVKGACPCTNIRHPIFPARIRMRVVSPGVSFRPEQEGVARQKHLGFHGPIGLNGEVERRKRSLTSLPLGLICAAIKIPQLPLLLVLRQL